MPLRPAGEGAWERVPPGGEGDAYVATPGLVELLRKWYETSFPWERMERVAIEHPDGWSVARRGRDGDRTVLTLVHGGTEAAVEVGYAGDWEDVRVSALPPEAAHELALERDEASRARGLTIHNTRHPRR